MLALSFMIPQRRSFPIPWMGAILAYAILTTVLLFFREPQRNVLNNLFVGLVLIKVLSERVSLNFKTVGNLLAVFCLINCLWIVLQIYNLDPVYSSAMPQNMPQVDRVGMMGLKANLGVLAALSFPLIFQAGWWKTIVCIPLLWFGRSSTCVLAFSVTALFVLWFTNRPIFWAALLVLIAAGIWYVGFVDMPSGQFSKRLKVWFAGIRILSGSNPSFGNGLGSWPTFKFTTIQENGSPETWVWAHNTFLQWLFEMGVIGTIILYGYFRAMASKLRIGILEHRVALSFMIPVVIVSFFHFPLHIARFAGLICYMFASTEALVYEGAKA